MPFGLLLICATSILGSWLANLAGIPIPGAILGLLLLTAIFLFRGESHATVDRASQQLTLLIPLLIMPSCIGLMDHWHLFKEEWLAILIAISLSVMLTLVTTPWMLTKLEKYSNEEGA